MAVPASVRRDMEELHERGGQIEAKLTYLAALSRKVGDDNRCLLADLRRFREEERERTKRAFAQLFSLTAALESQIQASTPALSHHTLKTELSDRVHRFGRVSTKQELKADTRDSFRRMEAPKCDGFLRIGHSDRL